MVNNHKKVLAKVVETVYKEKQSSTDNPKSLFGFLKWRCFN